MRLIKRLLIIVMIMLVVSFGVLFSIQNAATAPLDLLLFQLPEQRVALWILMAFTLGGIVGMIISSATLLHLRGRNILLQRKLDKHEKQLAKQHNTELKSVVSGKS